MSIQYVGLDVHKKMIAFCVKDQEIRGQIREIRGREIRGRLTYSF